VYTLKQRLRSQPATPAECCDEVRKCRNRRDGTSKEDDLVEFRHQRRQAMASNQVGWKIQGVKEKGGSLGLIFEFVPQTETGGGERSAWGVEGG
jgi:hypothetical protein